MIDNNAPRTQTVDYRPTDESTETEENQQVRSDGSDYYPSSEGNQVALTTIARTRRRSEVTEPPRKRFQTRAKQQTNFEIFKRKYGNDPLANAIYFKNIDAVRGECRVHSHHFFAAIEVGDCEIVDILLEKSNLKTPTEILSLRSSDGATLLHRTAAYGCIELLDYLLRKCSLKTPAAILSFCTSRETSLLYVAVSSGNKEIFDHLLQKCNLRTPAEILSFRRSGGSTFLHYAAANGQRKMLDHLFEKCSLKTPAEILWIIRDDGSTLLHSASAGGCTEMLDYLLQKCELTTDAEILSVTNGSGLTILHAAAALGQIRVLDYLLQKCELTTQAEILSVTNSSGLTILDTAAALGQIRVLDYLLEKCELTTPTEILSIKSNDQSTLIHLAASNNNRELVQSLLIRCQPLVGETWTISPNIDLPLIGKDIADPNLTVCMQILTLGLPATSHDSRLTAVRSSSLLPSQDCPITHDLHSDGKVEKDGEITGGILNGPLSGQTMDQDSSDSSFNSSVVEVSAFSPFHKAAHDGTSADGLESIYRYASQDLGSFDASGKTVLHRAVESCSVETVNWVCEKTGTTLINKPDSHGHPPWVYAVALSRKDLQGALEERGAKGPAQISGFVHLEVAVRVDGLRPAEMA